jgi:formylglycine-generating enzyme required for sulfatase activity
MTLEKEKYDDGYAYTAPVGAFVANKFGIYDLAGNVAEWVSDNYGEQYPDRGVLRGGSWGDGKTKDGAHPMLGASARNPMPPDKQEPTFGFRCVIAELPKQ